MDSKKANLEEKLKSLLLQLSSESGIIERIVHKSKNQHRGSLYFQALLKVRRDLRLLESAGLVQILNALFPIIRGKSPAENAHHSKVNNKRNFVGKHTYHNRLLGAARLLSQMVEPILKAAIQISLLLAKSFFMGFSLTILACLGRLRVLVQQILIDVVSVFNMVSTHSQKHSLKLSSEGIEAFVEYYSSGGDILTLECIWEDDKYVLHESTRCDNNKIPEQGAFPLETQYETLELLGEGWHSSSDIDHVGHIGFKRKGTLKDEKPGKKNRFLEGQPKEQNIGTRQLADDKCLCIKRQLKLVDDQPSKKGKIGKCCSDCHSTSNMKNAGRLHFKVEGIADDEKIPRKNQFLEGTTLDQNFGSEQETADTDFLNCIKKRLKLDDDHPTKKGRIDECNSGLPDEASKLPVETGFNCSFINVFGKRLREDGMAPSVLCEKIK